MSKNDEQGWWGDGISRERERPPERGRPPEPPDPSLLLGGPLPEYTGFASANREYVAFETRRRVQCLHTHCATQPSMFPAYHYLMNTIYDHNFDGVFRLIYSFMAVEVSGRSLGPIVHSLSFHACACIREFHSKLYEPPRKGSPLIEKIQIVAGAENFAAGGR